MYVTGFCHVSKNILDDLYGSTGMYIRAVKIGEKMKLVSKSERLKMQTGTKIIVFGPYGIGKTSLLKTIDEPTLCLDFEAGLLAVQDWEGDSISVRTWSEARDIACLIGGPNPALRADQAYSQKHYEHLSSKHKELSDELSKYRCIFIDSITVASRLCFLLAKFQPDAFSERSGKQDTVLRVNDKDALIFSFHEKVASNEKVPVFGNNLL
ncbi:MAG: hypothetical protein PG981_001399 [Wolbachia endosymbiont of Ctenocephalides orientis wCori]|nr:MAG: hypothetical protein PG981_001399 [Wolbachia endosymbiont of Ctenocephalides orientis wCori]